MPKRVVVTGFGPFLEHQANPSDALARRIAAATTGQFELVSESPLPVAYQVAAARAIAVVRSSSAVGIVCLGLAAKRTRISIETSASNLVTAESADQLGSMRAGQVIDPSAPDALETEIDVARFASSLAASGLAFEISTDAGGYVCNDLYFRLLRAHQSGEMSARALFVHVPDTVLSIADVYVAFRRAIEDVF